MRKDRAGTPHAPPRPTDEHPRQRSPPRHAPTAQESALHRRGRRHHRDRHRTQHRRVLRRRESATAPAAGRVRARAHRADLPHAPRHRLGIELHPALPRLARAHDQRVRRGRVLDVHVAQHLRGRSTAAPDGPSRLGQLLFDARRAAARGTLLPARGRCRTRRAPRRRAQLHGSSPHLRFRCPSGRAHGAHQRQRNAGGRRGDTRVPRRDARPRARRVDPADADRGHHAGARGCV